METRSCEVKVRISIGLVKLLYEGPKVLDRTSLGNSIIRRSQHIQKVVAAVEEQQQVSNDEVDPRKFCV